MPTRASFPPLTRRQFLKAAGGLSAVVALTDLSLALRPVDAASAAAGESGVSLIARVSDDPVVHAVKRLTFDLTPELVANVRAKGVDAFIEEQTHPMSSCLCLAITTLAPSR